MRCTPMTRLSVACAALSAVAACSRVWAVARGGGAGRMYLHVILQHRHAPPQHHVTPGLGVEGGPPTTPGDDRCGEGGEPPYRPDRRRVPPGPAPSTVQCRTTSPALATGGIAARPFPGSTARRPSYHTRHTSGGSGGGHSRNPSGSSGGHSRQGSVGLHFRHPSLGSAGPAPGTGHTRGASSLLLSGSVDGFLVAPAEHAEDEDVIADFHMRQAAEPGPGQGGGVGGPPVVAQAKEQSPQAVPRSGTARESTGKAAPDAPSAADGAGALQLDWQQYSSSGVSSDESSGGGDVQGGARHRVQAVRQGGWVLTQA